MPRTPPAGRLARRPERNRAQTLGARRADAEGVYSLGRVQTPTLALIVARDQEIATFVPVEYFEVVAMFQVAAGAYQGRWGQRAGEPSRDPGSGGRHRHQGPGPAGTVAHVETQTSRGATTIAL